MSSTIWPARLSGSGTVTSVDMTVPSFLSVSGVPITAAGIIAVTYSGVALPVANGGTGLTSGTSGGVLAYTASGVLASSGALTASRIVLGGGAGAAPTVLGSLGTTTTVLHGNAAGAPTFGAVSLTTDISGILPVANGGTNLASYTSGDLIYASGATALSKLSIGTANKVLTTDGSVHSCNLLVNANIDAAAAVAYSKLNLTGSILNADINASAAIVYSKLNLTGGILNADVNASAAIAYSKLNLATSIVNADISASAAIAYSKLNLATSIVNADVNASAAIAVSKLAALTASKTVLTDGSGFLTTGTPSIAQGGTGQVTQTAAFDALSPVTTKGDLIVRDSSNNIRVAVGANGTVLTADSGQTSGVKWVAAATAVAAKTSNYTLQTTDGIVTGDSSGGAFTFTLPDCATNSGKTFKLKKISADFTAISVTRAGADTITDAVASLTSTSLNTFGEEIEIASFGGTVWQVVSRRIPSVWTSYTPTGAWSSNTTHAGMYRRVGDSLAIRVFTALTGAPNAVAYSMTDAQFLNGLTGLSVDTAKFPNYTTNDAVRILGSWAAKDTGTGTYGGEIPYEGSGGRIFLIVSASGVVTDTVPFTFGNGDSVSLDFLVPMTGWNG